MTTPNTPAKQKQSLREALQDLIERTDEDDVYDGDDIINTLQCLLQECE